MRFERDSAEWFFFLQRYARGIFTSLCAFDQNELASRAWEMSQNGHRKANARQILIDAYRTERKWCYESRHRDGLREVAPGFAVGADRTTALRWLEAAESWAGFDWDTYFDEGNRGELARSTKDRKQVRMMPSGLRWTSWI